MLGHTDVFAPPQPVAAVLFTVILLGLTVMMMLTPMVWKRGVLFGVTVAPDALQQPEGRALLTRWRIVMGSVGVGLAVANLIITIVIPAQNTVLFVIPLLLGAFLVAYLSALFAFHQRALALALPAGNTLRAASLDANVRLRPPLSWEILPLAVIVATFIHLAVNYAAAPATIAIHWNADGNPDGFVVKTIGSYFLRVWWQLGLWLLLTLLGLGIINRRLAGRVGSSAAFYGMLTRLLFWIKTLTVVLFAVIATLTVYAQRGQSLPYAAAIVTGFLIVLFLAIIVSVQRFGNQMSSDTSLVTGDGSPDRYWHGGIFYSNPQDPALFVPRRIGIGVTLNLAHPASWLLLLVTAALIAFSIYAGVNARH